MLKIGGRIEDYRDPDYKSPAMEQAFVVSIAGIPLARIFSGTTVGQLCKFSI